MEVPQVIQNIRIWCATSVTRRGTLELIVGLARRNKILMSINWLEGMKISVTFYLLQTNRSVIRIYELLTLDVQSISVPIGRCSSHTLRFRREKSS